jgi:5-methylcytosine-specific restriction endonuclease McrA
MTICIFCQKEFNDERVGKPGRPHKWCKKCVSNGRHLPVQCVCKECGVEFKGERKSNGGRVFCSRRCAQIFNQRPRRLSEQICGVCGIKFHPRSRKSHCCSSICGAKYNGALQRVYWPTCLWCKKPFIPKKSDRILFCGKDCYISFVKEKGKPPAKNRMVNCGDRHFYRQAGSRIPLATRAAVFDRDRYICKLCGKPTLKSKNTPHHRAPTIDHIIPKSKGGSDDERNLQTACFKCNSLKSGTPLGQLRIF